MGRDNMLAIFAERRISHSLCRVKLSARPPPLHIGSK
jgi:hypothetical protein